MVAVARPIPLACSCASPLWRTVFAGENLRATGELVLACMRCGTVGAIKGVFEAIPYDPHDAMKLVGYETATLAPASRDWLAEWPRAVGEPLPPLRARADAFFISAQVRCADADELARAEAVARSSASNGLVERLRAAGIPGAPPPEDLPAGMWQFKAAWDALRRGDEAIIGELIVRGHLMQLPVAKP
jgi:hypothetical protein